MTEYNQELTKALQLAEAAGLLILEKRATALQNVTEKENNEGPVTEADLAADRLIRTGLENAFRRIRSSPKKPGQQKCLCPTQNVFGL